MPTFFEPIEFLLHISYFMIFLSKSDDSKTISKCYKSRRRKTTCKSHAMLTFNGGIVSFGEYGVNSSEYLLVIVGTPVLDQRYDRCLLLFGVW